MVVTDRFHCMCNPILRSWSPCSTTKYKPFKPSEIHNIKVLLPLFSTEGGPGLLGCYESLPPGTWFDGQLQCAARGGHMFAYETEVELRAITCKGHEGRFTQLNGWCIAMRIVHHFDGLVQERRNSSALAMEFRLSCTNPSILHCTECRWTMGNLSYPV